jgi:hypothetical protein
MRKKPYQYQLVSRLIGLSRKLSALADLLLQYGIRSESNEDSQISLTTIQSAPHRKTRTKVKPDDYEKLRNPNGFSLKALIALSKLRRKVAEYGYEFFNLKEGEAVLLLEAARLTNNSEAMNLATQFLDSIGIDNSEFVSKNLD